MPARPTRFFLTLACALALALPAGAREVGGVRFDETQTVAGKPLLLNGAAVRQSAMIKAFAIGLYLERKSTVAGDILAGNGPMRLLIHPLRDTVGKDLGQAFVAAMHKHSSPQDTARIAAQTQRFGELFAQLGALKKGDVIGLDWMADKGTVLSLNGVAVGAPLQDIAFYRAVLRIWLGETPAQPDMKPALLGLQR